MNKLAKFLIVDPQNDFCDTPVSQRPAGEAPALAVPGSNFDMLRVARFIEQAGHKLNRIVVTLDSHPFVAIERTTFWLGADGKEVDPFTQIMAEDVRAGRFTPVHGGRIEPISGKPLTERVIELLTLLEGGASKHKLMAWPVHCVTGTWGANIHPAVAVALAAYERYSQFTVRKAHKGEYPLAEHYGVFEAETPLWEVPSTRFNANLAEELTSDLTFVAGEASSHCVAASVEQLIRYRKTGVGIVLLTDCMSPVTGFEAAADAFLKRAVDAGAQLMTAEAAAQMLNA